MSSFVERFTALFEGRWDAFGSDEGGCARSKPDFAAHLDGARPMGIYPMIPSRSEWFVKWGAVDLDVKREGKRRYDYEDEADAIAAAVDLRAALALLDITGWIERTRSGGYHVWVFAEDWVPAASMRRALLVACQVAGVPPTEVNPKAESFDDPSTLGNYVRLPYPGHLTERPHAHSASRVVYLGGGVGTGFAYLTLDHFVGAAWKHRATEQQISAAASLHKPPPVRKHRAYGDAPELDRVLTDKLSGLTWTMYSEGPIDEDVDRSGWLYRLACRCCDDDLTPEEALVIVTAADEAHTRKYVDRADGERQLERTIERAYR